MTNEPGALRLTSLGLAEEEGVVLGELRPGPGGTVVRGPHGSGKSQIMAALQRLQSLMQRGRLDSRQGRYVERPHGVTIKLTARGVDDDHELSYDIAMELGGLAEIAHERLVAGSDKRVEMVSMEKGDGTIRATRDSAERRLTLASSEMSAASMAGGLKANVEAVRFKHWVERWKLSNWSERQQYGSEARTRRAEINAAGWGAMASIGWLQESDQLTYEGIRVAVAETTGGRLADIEAIRSPDDGVTLEGRLQGQPKVPWHHWPRGMQDAVRLETLIALGKPGDLIMLDCPDSEMDTELARRLAARVAQRPTEGAQIVMLTRRDPVQDTDQAQRGRLQILGREGPATLRVRWTAGSNG